jgi:GDP-mannose pyrophosphatase NudK
MNPNIKIKEKRILSDQWYLLSKVIFEQKNKAGQWELVEREAYDRGNGAAILLYHPIRKTVLLTRQFRMPTYINGNTDGMMVEACAGLLDENAPEECIRKEAEEELGYRVSQVEKVMEAYMSPGSVTEKLYYFIGTYDSDQKISEGGGLQTDHEQIEVLEYDFDKALHMISTGEIQDGKTIILLFYLRLNGLL